MATILTHAIVAGTLGFACSRTVVSWGWLRAGMFLSMLPDVDVISFALGIPYDDPCGHRGITHSFGFAAVAAVMLMGLGWSRTPVGRRGWLWCYLFIACASHPLLDALTDGGLGVAFFAPFSDQRYFFPLRPIAVSPIGGGFFSRAGLDVLACEARWLWALSAAVIALVCWRRRVRLINTRNQN